jgi:hypothetical protein
LKRFRLAIFAVGCTLFFLPKLGLASGAIQVDINGLPLLWDAQDTLTYNPENGALKANGAFDQNATLQMLSNAFNTWGNLPTIQLNVQQGAFLTESGDPVDVNQFNYSQFLGTGTEECYPDFFDVTGDNCVTPIVFDEDGKIIDDLFGNCARFSILGFAGYDDVDDGSGDPARRTVRRGQALFSGACLAPAESQDGCAPCQRVLTDNEIRTIVTHEVGHLMGMDHSQVNPEAFADCIQQPGGCPAAVSQALPTMFPILVNGAHMLDLHRDDEAYFIHLYGNDLSQGCTVSGSVFASDGTTPVRGVEVMAKNVNGDLTDRISFISGAEAPRRNNFSRTQGNCSANCGDYRITHLRDGGTYQLCVQRISSQFTGGSSIEPVDPPFQAFSNDCPAELTVSCDCSGPQCSEFSDVDIVTDTDPSDVDLGDDEPGNITDTGGDSGVGCSLHRYFPPTGVWNTLLKSLQ